MCKINVFIKKNNSVILLLFSLFLIYIEYGAIYYQKYCFWKPAIVGYTGSFKFFYESFICGLLLIIISLFCVVFKGKIKIKILFLIVFLIAAYLTKYPVSYVIDWNNHTIGWHKVLQTMQKSTFKSNSEDLFKYVSINKKLPNTLSDAINKDNRSEQVVSYLLTAGSKNTNTVQEFDGTGGWVYDPEKGIFGINVNGMEEYSTNFTEYLKEIKKDYNE